MSQKISRVVSIEKILDSKTNDDYAVLILSPFKNSNGILDCSQAVKVMLKTDVLRFKLTVGTEFISQFNDVTIDEVEND